MCNCVCRCCGGEISPEWQRADRHICVACEQLLEDDSPKTLAALLGALPEQPLPSAEGDEHVPAEPTAAVPQ